MNQYLKDLLAVTEVLITKDLQQEAALRIYPDAEYMPSYDIFDEDIQDVGMSFASFGVTLGELEKKNYISLNQVVGFDDLTSKLPHHADTFQKILATGRERKPDARFNVWVKGNIWRLHEAISKEEDIEKVVIGTSAYLPNEYTLLVLDHKVPIKLKNDAPNEHYILSHMMERGFDQQYDFSDLDDLRILGDSKDNPRTYYDSCKHLNEKIEKATNGTIKNFFQIHGGATGSVRVNPKYL
jgi:hypothetical protein